MHTRMYYTLPKKYNNHISSLLPLLLLHTTIESVMLIFILFVSKPTRKGIHWYKTAMPPRQVTKIKSTNVKQ